MAVEAKAKKNVISVKGANLHNLKNISVEIPHNKLTVITGVSGSGKSTLAFDTIYAEGQRRFVESLSAYARQFLERMNKPDVESINGLPPAIAIEQKPPSRNPRSTVGTSTEIYDYLRLLYGRIGTTICRSCGKVVKKDSPQSVVDEIMKFDEGDRLYILFPLSQQARNLEDEIKKIEQKGFFRIILKDSDEIIDIHTDTVPEDTEIINTFVLADRVVVHNDKESATRLNESIELAMAIGDGMVIIKNLTNQTFLKFSSHFECADCDIMYQEPEPRLFSFNNPFGACPTCQGFGRTIGIDEELVFPDKNKSIRKGAIHPFRTQGYANFLRDLIMVAPLHNIPLDEPIQTFSKEQMDFLWAGDEIYPGLNGLFQMLEEGHYKVHYRVMTSRYRGYTKCKACGGSRLRTSARQVFIRDSSIPDLIHMPLGEVLKFLENLNLNEYEFSVVGQVMKELVWRIQLLVDIGLEYLTLDRLSHTLSGGEAQRINLSSALGSSLVGTLYVLDEPSIGMHPRDTGRLLSILDRLKNLGNTIIVVEHDPDIIRHADCIVDIGPKAGEQGGEIIYSGAFAGVMNAKNSLTGAYLSGKLDIPIPELRIRGNGKKIVLHKPKENNLKMSQVVFPLGCMTVVTGVSGSGKSSLVYDVLYAGLRKLLVGFDEHVGAFEKIEGYSHLDGVEMVDQSSIGKSSRSTPITYIKVFDLIRELFASTQAAKQMGWKPGYFSFNVPGGRCEVCEGEGTVTVDMQFLPDVHLECEACKGTRYKKEARSILYKGKSIVDVLNMTVDEALEFFGDIHKIVKKMQVLKDVGLGYLKMGQPSSMLSGGESQRIKLANHLESDYHDNILYIFDEPTTGLHLDDISKLLTCFHRLVEKGNSVLIIEHNLHIISSADWIIDLGPEAGENGGEIVATGTPEQIAHSKNSYTGKALKVFLNLPN